MPDIPREGAHVRIWLSNGRVIDCKVGRDVGEGKVTILPDGRGEHHWEAIPWREVWSIRPLEEKG